MKTSILVFAASGAVLGYYALSGHIIAALICLAACAALPLCVTALPKSGRALISAALCAGLIEGFIAGSLARVPFSPGLPPARITSISGALLDDPRALSRSGMAQVDVTQTGAKNIPGAYSARSSASGRLTVFFPPEATAELKEFGRGGEVYAEGWYNAEKGTFSARSAHLLNPGSPLERFRTKIRLFLAARLNALDPSGLAEALLLGYRDNLSGDLAQSYREAGLSHILALSGMHLAFLSALLAFALKRPLGKNAAALAGLAFIAVYVFLVGPQPSLLRAALMYAMGALIAVTGLPRNTAALLCAAFLIQIAADPSSGTSVSFILSYTALSGLLSAGAALSRILRGRLPPFLAGPLSASAGAFVVTAPFVAFFFGALRPAGIVAGLAAVPLSALFMALSAAGLVLSFIPPAAALFAFLLRVLGAIITRIVSAAAALPGIKAPPVPVLAASILIGAAVFAADRWVKSRRNLAAFE